MRELLQLGGGCTGKEEDGEGSVPGVNLTYFTGWLGLILPFRAFLLS